MRHVLCCGIHCDLSLVEFIELYRVLVLIKHTVFCFSVYVSDTFNDFTLNAMNCV